MSVLPFTFQNILQIVHYSGIRVFKYSLDKLNLDEVLLVKRRVGAQQIEQNYKTMSMMITDSSLRVNSIQRTGLSL